MLSWCKAFELPIWNFGCETAEHFDARLLAMWWYTCIMGLGSECMHHYVQFGSCTWSKSILYINSSRYKSVTYFIKQLCHAWGTAHFWTSRRCLKTPTTLGAWLLGPDSWPDRYLSELMCWMRKKGTILLVTDWCKHSIWHISCRIQCLHTLWISDLQFSVTCLIAAQVLSSIGPRRRTPLLQITCWRLWVKVLKAARGDKRLQDVRRRK